MLLSLAVLALLLSGYLLYSKQPVPVAKNTPLTMAKLNRVEGQSQQTSAQTLVMGDSTVMPADVSKAEWQTVQAIYGTASHTSKLKQQAGEFLGFKHRIQQWSVSDMPAKATLASQLLNELPTHLARQEMTAGEAKQLTMQLLADQNRDAGLQEQAVNAQLEKMHIDQAALTPTALQQQAAQVAYKQQEDLLVAQWQALPEAQRSQQQLQDQLQAVRHATYDAFALPTPQ